MIEGVEKQQRLIDQELIIKKKIYQEDNRKFKIFFYICKRESANDKIDRWEKDCQGWLRKENS